MPHRAATQRILGEYVLSTGRSQRRSKWPHLDHVWCRDCNFKPVYTYGTPFHEKHLTCGEVLLAFTLYASTLLSINQIAALLGRAYKTTHTAIRGVEAAIHHGFPVVWELLDQTFDGPTQVDESGTVCSGYKCQEPPRNSRSRGGSSQTGVTLAGSLR